ncbi:MAG: hypothetical protein K0U37_00825 [Gammaproteobacteria bacterium]|nr:hypothetical protein [Gammaproteobacteria bacterium]
MYEMTIQSLLEPFKQQETFKKILPTLMVQGVVFVLALQFSRMIPRDFDSWISEADEAEDSIEVLARGMGCLLLLVAYDWTRHWLSENAEMTANVFSKEINAFYAGQCAQLEAYHDELLKKNKKNTEQLIVSVSNMTLDVSILGLAFYDTEVSGFSYHLALAYCMLRGFLAVTHPRERVQGLPTISPEAQIEMTQNNRQGFFSVAQQTVFTCSSVNARERAGLAMMLAAIFSGVTAPHNMGLYVQVCGTFELLLEHVSDFKKTSTEISERFSLS